MSTPLVLHDHADGIKGHYCIGRLIGNGPYWEFWNKDRWTGCGQVFTSKHAAVLVMRSLAAGVADSLKGKP